MRNVDAPQPISTADSVEAEEHDGQERGGQTDDPTQGPSMSVCVQCAQPTVGELCSHHAVAHGADWATGNRIMCDFLHRGIVPAIPDDVPDPSIEFLVDTLELALTP